jgi:hypothetical protein
MDILNISALINEGKSVNLADIDPTKAYVQIGVFQKGNRQLKPGNPNTYTSYVIPVSELGGGVTYTASNGIALVGNDFQLASNLISQFTNDSGYLTSTDIIGMVTGSGTSNYHTKWGAIAGTLVDSIIFDNGTNVGIGTITPGAKLELSGATGNRLFLNTAGDGFGIQGGVMQYFTNSSVSIHSFGYGSSTSFTESVRITGDGRLGVNLQGNPLNGQAQIRVAVDSQIYFGQIGGVANIQAVNDGVTLNVPLEIYFSRLSLLGGNIGVGTSNPTDLLSVYHTKSSTAMGPTIDSINLGGHYSNTAGANPKLKIYDDGNVMGIGASAGQMDYITYTNVSHVFYSAGSMLMYVGYDGNIGIGTSIRPDTLTVNGTFRVTPPSGSFSINTSGLVGINQLSPTASTHIQGIDSTSGNYSLKIDNSSLSPILYVRNDNVIDFNNGNLRVITTGGISTLDVPNYISFKISMTGSYGDFLTFSHLNGNWASPRQLIMFSGSNPSQNCGVEIGTYSGVSSLGVKNIAVTSSTSGWGVFAVGAQGTGGAFGSATMRFSYEPVSFGGLITDINNNYYRVGVGTDVVLGYRMVIADGLQVLTGGFDSNAYSVSGVSGVSGTFISADAKTITVTNGIIINIV